MRSSLFTFGGLGGSPPGSLSGPKRESLQPSGRGRYGTLGQTACERYALSWKEDETMAGLSPTLNEELENAKASDLVEVVVELRRGGTVTPDQNVPRAERITALRESFDREVAPVEEIIRRAGGEVTGRAWINQTVRARVPAQKVKELASDERVQAVDVPHAVAPDRA